MWVHGMSTYFSQKELFIEITSSWVTELRHHILMRIRLSTSNSRHVVMDFANQLLLSWATWPNTTVESLSVRRAVVHEEREATPGVTLPWAGKDTMVPSPAPTSIAHSSGAIPKSPSDVTSGAPTRRLA